MADFGRPGANYDTRETALLEALWRGDELAAALKTVNGDLDSVRRQLTRAEEAAAELSEIGEAAQAAIDQLRGKIANIEAAMQLYLGQRDALAAELFRAMRRCEAALGAKAAAVCFGSADGAAIRPGRRRRRLRQAIGRVLAALTPRK